MAVESFGVNTPGKMYIDKRGWKYKVMKPKSDGYCYKVGVQNPERLGNGGWIRSTKTAFPWRDTYGEAQQDLDAYAKRHGWKEWDGRG